MTLSLCIISTAHAREYANNPAWHARPERCRSLVMSEPAAVAAAELTVVQDPPKLRELVEELCSAATKWYSIGLQLDIHPDALDKICGDDLGTALRLMLREWEKREEQPSWSAVVKVLQCQSVAEYVLAKNLQERYIGRASRHQHHTREKRRQPYQPSPASEDPRK